MGSLSFTVKTKMHRPSALCVVCVCERDSAQVTRQSPSSWNVPAVGGRQKSKCLLDGRAELRSL